MPKVSVIMPVYKTEATVAAAIESVLAQTMQDLELVCVNDGSPDRAGEVLSSYAAKDARIRVFNQENRGQGAARNRALEAAQGEYVLFLDSDDLLTEDAVELMVTVADRERLDLVASRAYAVKGRGVPKSGCALTYRLHDNPLKTVVEDRHLRSSPWNKLYRRETLGALRFEEGIVFEDWPFVTLFAARVKKMAVLGNVCYVYSKDGASTVRSAFGEFKLRSYVKGIRAVASELGSSTLWPLARRRCAIAASMMINKVSKTKDAELHDLCRVSCRELRAEGLLRHADLPFKTLLRLFFL